MSNKKENEVLFAKDLKIKKMYSNYMLYLVNSGSKKDSIRQVKLGELTASELLSHVKNIMSNTRNSAQLKYFQNSRAEIKQIIANEANK